MKPLARMVARFCGTLARLPERETPYVRSSACARTMGYGAPPDLYNQAIQIRRHLVDLGVGIDVARSGTATSTQRALQQLQHAYRNLQGLMIGAPERLLDIQPESERRSVRELLQTALSGSRLQAPTLHATVPAAPCRNGSGALSAMFETGELNHRSLVETFRNMPERARQHASKEGEALATLIVNARLSHLHKHLLLHRAELSRLLKALGHRRTVPMRLAHGIFLALGDLEGAMIGAESRYEPRCQPLIDLIAVRTNELGRYC